MGDSYNISTPDSSSDGCAYGYDSVGALAGVNLTDEVKLAWPCVLREYWYNIAPLTQLTQGLMFYGTVVVISTGLLFNIISTRILYTPALQKQSNSHYLLALSVYDSCVLIFNFMIGVLRAQNSDTINAFFQQHEWLCIAHSVVVELFSLLSIWMIVCLTAERLIVVFLPLKVRQFCTPKRARLVIIIVSLLVVVISCHKILVSGFEGDSVFGYKACHTRRKIISHAVFFYVAFNTWLPTLTIIVINVVIARAIRNAASSRESMSATRFSSSQSVASSKNSGMLSNVDMKVIRTMKAVSVTYLLLVLPLGFIQSFELYWNNVQKSAPSLNGDEQRDYVYYQKGKIMLKHIRTLAFFFYQWNFAVNFFIYFIRNDKFRLEFHKLFPCLPIPKSFRKKEYHVSSNTNSATLASSGDL